MICMTKTLKVESEQFFITSLIRIASRAEDFFDPGHLLNIFTRVVTRGRQDQLFFDLKSDQSLDLLILNPRS
jgi:hypothetical protein